MANGSYKRRRAIRLGAFQDNLCFFCDTSLLYLDPEKNYEHHRKQPQPNSASFDHYLSRKCGGSGRKENTVIACRSCNSKKGHESTPEFDEKLRQLNIRRGYGDEHGNVSSSKIIGYLEPHTFGPPDLAALNNLCSMVNQIEGAEGQKIRRMVGRRLRSHTLLLKQLSPVRSKSLKQEIVGALRKTRKKTVTLPPIIEDHLDNVLSSFTKKWLRNDQ